MGLLAVVIVGCEVTGRRPEAALEMSVDDFARALTVAEASSGQSTQISSQPGYRPDMRNVPGEASDAYLYADIDRANRRITYRVYFTEVRRSANWSNPSRATFGDPPQTVQVDRVDYLMDCSNSGGNDDNNCLRTDIGVFDVPEMELESALTDGGDYWEFRVKNQSSYDLVEGLPTNEIRAVMGRAQAILQAP